MSDNKKMYSVRLKESTISDIKKIRDKYEKTLGLKVSQSEVLEIIIKEKAMEI